MAKKPDLEHKGTLDVYGPKPPKDDGEWLWVVGFGIVVLFLLSTCS